VAEIDVMDTRMEGVEGIVERLNQYVGKLMRKVSFEFEVGPLFFLNQEPIFLFETRTELQLGHYLLYGQYWVFVM
jgi:hypothetical protein